MMTDMTSSNRARSGLLAAVGAIAPLAVAVTLMGTTATSSSAATTTDVLAAARTELALCQAKYTLAVQQGNTAMRNRAGACISDDTALIKSLTSTPSPTPSTSPSPTPTVTTTATTSPSPSSSPSPSTSPSTSPTSPSAGTYPNATNRGLPAGTALTNDSRCVIGLDPNTGQPEHVTGRHFTCRLSMSVDGVVITNSQLDQGIDNWSANRSYTISDSTLGVTSTCYDGFGLGATAFTATRVKVIGFSDGVRLSGLDGRRLSVTDSYVAPCHLSGAHSDGAQGDGNVAPVTLSHNTIDLRSICPVPSLNNCDWTASVFFPTVGALTVTDNVLAGGGWVLQIDGTGPDVITNNKLVDGSWEYGPTRVTCSIVTQWTGNVAVTLDANGQPSAPLWTVPCA
jgi:hypothetical protein